MCRRLVLLRIRQALFATPFFVRSRMQWCHCLRRMLVRNTFQRPRMLINHVSAHMAYAQNIDHVLQLQYDMQIAQIVLAQTGVQGV